MDLPGSKIPTHDVVCPLATQQGAFPHGNNHSEDEINIDLFEIARILFRGKYLILAVTLIAVIVGVIYAKSLPNIYMAEALVIPAKRIAGSGGGPSLASQFGGVAAALGVNLGGGGGRSEGEKDVYLVIMRTRPFAEYTVKEFNLLPLLAGEINKKNPETVKPEDAANMLLDGLKIVKIDKELGVGSRISFSGESPALCLKMVETLVKSINKYSQYDTIERAKKDIAMANAQLQQSTAIMMRAALWDIISQKTMEIVVAQAQEDFSFRVVEPAELPQRKFAPRRSSIVASFAAVGLLIGVLAALLLALPFFQKKSS